MSFHGDTEKSVTEAEVISLKVQIRVVTAWWFLGFLISLFILANIILKNKELTAGFCYE